LTYSLLLRYLKEVLGYKSADESSAILKSM